MGGWWAPMWAPGSRLGTSICRRAVRCRPRGTRAASAQEVLLVCSLWQLPRDLQFPWKPKNLLLGLLFRLTCSESTPSPRLGLFSPTSQRTLSISKNTLKVLLSGDFCGNRLVPANLKAAAP